MVKKLSQPLHFKANYSSILGHWGQYNEFKRQELYIVHQNHNPKFLKNLV